MNHIRCLSVGRHRQSGAWHMASHSHPSHEMVVFLSGNERVTMPHGTVDVGPGEAILFQAGVAHEEWQWGHDELETIYFQIDAALTGEPLPVRVDDRDGRLRQLACWLNEERVAGRWDGEFRHTLVHAVLQEFVRLGNAADAPMVELVRRHVRENPGATHTLDHLAALAGLSKFHFGRTYQALTGRTPMADVRAIRLAHARDLILTTSQPLKVIAEMAGLGDKASLSRLFRQHFEISPSDLRQRHRPMRR